MRLFSVFLCALPLVALARAAHADTFNVPGDSDTIQGAVDLADGDDVIIVKRGTYNETVRIEDLDGITLCAKGKVVIDNGGEADALIIERSNNITVKKITIQNTEDAIEVDRCDDVTILSCKITNADGVAIRANDCERLLIEKCKVDFTDGNDGISFVNVNNSTIEKCKFERIGEVTINIQSGSDNKVLRNKAKGTEAGIDLGVGSRNLFERNVVLAVEDEAFASGTTSSNNTWMKNKAKRGASAGIREQGTNNVWEGNALTRMETGLQADGDDNTFRRNKLIQSLENGISCRGTGNTFDDNKVDRSRVDGLEMRGSLNTVTGNNFKRSVRFDIKDNHNPFVGPNVYTDNKFKSSDPDDIQP